MSNSVWNKILSVWKAKMSPWDSSLFSEWEWKWVKSCSGGLWLRIGLSSSQLLLLPTTFRRVLFYFHKLKKQLSEECDWLNTQLGRIRVRHGIYQTGLTPPAARSHNFEHISSWLNRSKISSGRFRGSVLGNFFRKKNLNLSIETSVGNC